MARAVRLGYGHGGRLCRWVLASDTGTMTAVCDQYLGVLHIVVCPGLFLDTTGSTAVSVYYCREFREVGAGRARRQTEHWRLNLKLTSTGRGPAQQP